MSDEKLRTLLVIDIQNDFCPGGSMAVPHGDEIIPVVNRMAPGFDNVVATGDWHPPGHISFASRHDEKPFQTIQVDGMQQELWPDHCIPGTEGARFHPQLDTRPFNLILHKGSKKDLDSYSAFFENDRITPTGLEFYLKGLKVTDVYVCGLALDVCVFYTVMDALKTGFTTYLVEDASRGINPPDGSLEDRLRKMSEAGAVFTTAAELTEST
jgi:nicotinamidase/pyrazinamidase